MAARRDAVPSAARRGTPPRPRRGRPADTRARLVAAAAAVFNRVGYRGTDSNQLARAAGYAPGTFYKHFPDKRAVFLAAYEAWVTAEWAAIERVMRRGGARPIVAARLVTMVIALHRRWRGLRASLRALVAEDPVARAFYRGQRRRQLRLLAALEPGGTASGRGEANAVLLYTLERVCDAIADGELRDLGLRSDRAAALLRRLIARQLPARR